VHAVRNRAYRERGARQIGIGARELPSADDASKKTVRLEGQIIDAAYAEILCPVEIRQPPVRMRIGRVVYGAAAIQPV